MRLSWLTRNPDVGRQRVADHLDLVVLGGDLDEPESDVVDRVVRAVVPEPQAARLGAGGAADDLVAEADAEQRPPVVDDRPRERDRRRRAGPGRPGPGDRTTPSMSGASTSGGRAVCGKTRTRAPRRRIARTMFVFSPKSTIAISGPPSPAAPMSVTGGGETWPTKSWSSQRGTARAAAARGVGGRSRPAP